jgi:hypothetical protein
MIELFVCLVVGYVIGNIHTVWKLRRLIAEAGVDLETGLIKTPAPTTQVYKLKIESVDDILYLYNKETNDFVCQANTMEELAQTCKDYKNIMVATVIHDSKVFIFANGKYQEFKG